MSDEKMLFDIKIDFGNVQANETWEAIKIYAMSGKVAAMNLGLDRAPGLVRQHTIDGHDLLAKFQALVDLLPAVEAEVDFDFDEEDRQWDEPDEDDYLGAHAG